MRRGKVREKEGKRGKESKEMKACGLEIGKEKREGDVGRTEKVK